MTTTIEDIRYDIEQDVQESITNEQMILWANHANANFGVQLNVPATATIALDTTTLKYAEPTGLKQIQFMYLQSDYDNGVLKEFTWPYKRFNGYIWFNQPYVSTDTLNINYFKDLTHFTNITDTIDLADQYASIYTFYGEMKYYSLPQVIDKLGTTDAKRKMDDSQSKYYEMRDAIISLYAMKTSDYVVKERW